MPTHSEFAEGLREVADFIAAHPEVPLPENTLTCYELYNKDVAAVVAKAMSQGGRVEKVYEEHLFTLKRTFGEVTLQYLGTRSNVCEQVRVGTRIVPEQYVPPQPAREGQIIPQHEEPVYEYRCAPLLGKPDIQIEASAPELHAPEVLQLEEENAIPF